MEQDSEVFSSYEHDDNLFLVFYEPYPLKT